MALVHDLAEAVTGDSATRVSGLTGEQKKLQKTRKQEREARAMDELRALGLPERVFESWREYEEAETAEAIFVRDMNLIDMCAQALIYERGGRYREEELGSNFPEFEGLSEFFETTRMRLATEIGRSLFTGLEDEYRSLRAGGR
jgi:putative hydrolase of HD superfamily